MRKIDASYRVMKLFKMLYKNAYSMDELLQELSEGDNYITKDTISKYIKTIREFGCNVRKRQGKFKLLSVPFSLDLSDGDFYRLATFANLGSNLYGENIRLDLTNALEKILSLSDSAGYCRYSRYLNEALSLNNVKLLHYDKISKLLKYSCDNAKIKILYLDGKMNVSNISFKYADNAVFVHVFNEDSKSYELLFLENIKEVYSTPNTSIASAFAPYTVFSIRGRLKNSYTLYEGEKVIKVQKDCIVISNNFEDKSLLLRRLVRYGEFCKIISPESDVEKFKTMVRSMRENLEKANSLEG